MLQLQDLVCANVEENGKKVAKTANFCENIFQLQFDVSYRDAGQNNLMVFNWKDYSSKR